MSVAHFSKNDRATLENRLRSLRACLKRGAQHLILPLCRAKARLVSFIADPLEEESRYLSEVLRKKGALRMKSPGTTGNASTVADLKNRWDTLHVLDRAKAINTIRQSGISIRSLAVQLGRSEATLRRLLETARAPLLDRTLARQGKISTNELVRRSKAAMASRAAKNRETLECERTKAAQKACQEICAWLREEGLGEAHGEAIADEARRKMAAAEYFETLPASKAPLGTSLAEIIQRLRPPESINSDVGSVDWYADWLTRWAYFAWPDSSVRDKALGLALAKQINPGIF
ncbi:MAG: hypothetical protein P4L87_09125 [Formivibrio sp.]|nr:hypothetical protein [Formivibrio sp.]